MLQQLVVYCCAVAHHQELRCRSWVQIPMTLLKENNNIFNSCHEVFRGLPQDSTESSVLDRMIVRYEVPNLDRVLVMQYQFWVSNCYDGFVRQQGHS